MFLTLTTMKNLFLAFVIALSFIGCAEEAAEPTVENTAAVESPHPEIPTSPHMATHPDVSSEGWADLLAPDLSNAMYSDTVWSFEGGILTATEDFGLWTEQEYDNFMLDLEFKTAEGTNSGVIIYTSDIDDWIPNSIEIQIADDYAEQWATSPATWQCAAIFGHKAASKRTVKQPGEWNRYTITAVDNYIWVMLNGELVNEIDLTEYTSATTNPDGSEIPEWLSTPLAELPTHGRIGFQGKHAGAPIWFRNLKIKAL